MFTVPEGMKLNLAPKRSYCAETMITAIQNLPYLLKIFKQKNSAAYVQGRIAVASQILSHELNTKT